MIDVPAAALHALGAAVAQMVTRQAGAEAPLPAERNEDRLLPASDGWLVIEPANGRQMKYAMEAVGHPVAVNPRRKLRRIAECFKHRKAAAAMLVNEIAENQPEPNLEQELLVHFQAVAGAGRSSLA
jgi:hypothetical protein